MTRPDPSAKPKAPRPDSRDARLKAALKANIGRRKAQARERAQEEDGEDDDTNGASGQAETRGQADKD